MIMLGGVQLDITQSPELQPTEPTRPPPAPSTAGDAWSRRHGDDAPGDSLYAVLGVDRDATQVAIDQAYRAFRYSAEGEAAAFPNERVEFAYSTLSNRLKRQLYDKFGEAALLAAEEHHTLAAADMLGLQVAALMLAFVAVCITLTLFATVLLAALKLDNVKSARWGVILTPLWVFWWLLLISTMLLTYTNSRRRQLQAAADHMPKSALSVAPEPPAAVEATTATEDPEPELSATYWSDVLHSLVGALSVLGYALSSFMIPPATDESIPPWAPVVPAFAVELFWSLLCFTHPTIDDFRQSFLRRGARHLRTPLVAVVWFVHGYTHHFRFVIALLLVLRLTGAASFSWVIPVIPFLVFCVLWVMLIWANGVIVDENQPHMRRRGWLDSVVAHAVVLALLATGASLCALRHAEVFIDSWVLCVSPFLVLLLAAFILAAIGLYKAATLTVDSEAFEPPMYHRQLPQL